MANQQLAAMRMALEALEALVQHIEYCGDEDEVGVFVCCGEVSYRPHSAFCKTTKAITALREQLAQPQGEWVDLTWDDYLELAGQERFYVKDPHTGIMDFCSHEFTKAAIELFKDKNA